MSLQKLWLNNQNGGGLNGTIDVVTTTESVSVLWLHGNQFTGNRKTNKSRLCYCFCKSDTEIEHAGHLMPMPGPMVAHSAFENIWISVKEPNAGLIGIYSEKLGTGLTTVINYLNNRFLEPPCFYDYVFLCPEAYGPAIVREQIAEQIGISKDPAWKDETAFKVLRLRRELKNKRFVLLMDGVGVAHDICLDLIGVPNPITDQNHCKVIFTTTSEFVCDLNKPDAKILVSHLSEEDSWTLFAQIIGHQKLNSNAEICRLATAMAEQCFGLPKVRVVVARLMKSHTKLQQWDGELDIMKNLHIKLKSK